MIMVSTESGIKFCIIMLVPIYPKFCIIMLVMIYQLHVYFCQYTVLLFSDTVFEAGEQSVLTGRRKTLTMIIIARVQSPCLGVNVAVVNHALRLEVTARFVSLILSTPSCSAVTHKRVKRDLLKGTAAGH